ncbi:baseplate assembly protein, partial [Escherichia coli]|nr:baseplate assembly protein [Escherichia coli]
MPAVDLSELPTPQIIETPDFEVILAEMKESMITAFPQTQQAAVRSAMALESEPLTVIAQTFALRELLHRQRINEGAAACMLSHSSGSNLDNLAANMNTARLVITPATDT